MALWNLCSRNNINIYCLLNEEKTRMHTLPMPMPMLVAFIEFARWLLCAKGSWWKKSLNPSKLENFHIDIYIASDSGVEIIDSNVKKCGNTMNPNDWYFAGCTFWITIFSLIGLLAYLAEIKLKLCCMSLNL